MLKREDYCLCFIVLFLLIWSLMAKIKCKVILGAHESNLMKSQLWMKVHRVNIANDSCFFEQFEFGQEDWFQVKKKHKKGQADRDVVFDLSWAHLKSPKLDNSGSAEAEARNHKRYCFLCLSMTFYPKDRHTLSNESTGNNQH